MILVGNQRGGGKNLAHHLLKDENERVQVHQIRGFASDNLEGAFKESYAMSRATKCKQHLFSLSLNPPHEADTSPELFENTADRAEEQLGLSGQPRAIVFHTKNGRTHAHAVWCRVDTENMKAIQLSFSKRKMQNLSRDLYREHGWQMPRGFERSEYANPRNYSLAEWQQAKRAERDPAKLKAMFQDSWAVSDSKSAFENALREKGFHLAKGDRRGHVAVDLKGEVYPLSRWTGVKTKDIRARLGDPRSLRTVEDAQQQAKEIIAERLLELQAEQAREEERRAQKLERERLQKLEEQKAHRAKVKTEQEERQKKERAEREARLREGLKGLLDRITGRRRKTLRYNAAEEQQANQRDHIERVFVAQAQEQSRTQLQEREEKMREEFMRVRRELETDQAAMRQKKQTENEREALMRSRREANVQQKHSRARDGPGLGR